MFHHWQHNLSLLTPIQQGIVVEQDTRPDLAFMQKKTMRKDQINCQNNGKKYNRRLVEYKSSRVEKIDQHIQFIALYMPNHPPVLVAWVGIGTHCLPTKTAVPILESRREVARF